MGKNIQGADGRFLPHGNLFENDGQNIYCYDSDHNLLFFTESDNADLIINRTWCKLAEGYSATHVNGKPIATHRFLIGAKDGELVDHINGNKKDNRLSNLRICDKSQNAYNSKIRRQNTSGYTGVYYRKDTHKWAAEIHNHNKKIVLGSFDNKDDAIAARHKAEAEYIGEFRRGA